MDFEFTQCDYPGCNAKGVSRGQYANGPYETVNSCDVHKEWAEAEVKVRFSEYLADLKGQ